MPCDGRPERVVTAHMAKDGIRCYISLMIASLQNGLPPALAQELESRFFWWEPVGSRPRSAVRILAQAMNFAPFEIVQRLERELGCDRLAAAMLRAEPVWFSDRSWEFWRGRLALATGRAIPEEPPRRSFDARSL